ncbi:LuxR family transcriptional regulator [Burkholderia cepacia]|uniref:response regulator n=1 Tax=Burkholderia cepacia TaxID=292 RepID=UPI00075C25F1|nr:response regulator transcription factor [Burkholderia cepacia]KWH39383.1 LuxR family transcriptional regulator [Burkholderia cepacia]
MKILIVDDHPIVRDGVEALLHQNDAHLTFAQAGSADEATRLLDQHNDFDIAVIDLQMHGKGGLESISRIAAERPELLIIVLSSSEDPYDVRVAFAHGARGYVPKSASPQTLLSAITMVLNGDRYVPPLVLAEPSPSDLSPVRYPFSDIQAARPSAMLTARQTEVLRYIAEGIPNKVIAVRLNLSEKTVKCHVTAIFKALNVINRTQAAVAGRKAGLI